jgi:hypothetical protein
VLVLGTLSFGVTVLGCSGSDPELDSTPELGSVQAAATVDLCAGVDCTPSDACHAAGVCNPTTGQCDPGGSLADTTTGIGHHWTFDEPSGTAAVDSAGTSNGTLGSSALRWPSFDGTGGIALDPTAECDLQAEVDFGNAPGAFGTGDFTVSFWVATKFSGAGLGDLIGNRVAASRGNYLSGRLVANGRPSLEVDDNAPPAAITSSATINDGNWHNVVYVRSGTSLSFYVDGALTGSTTAVAANVLGNAPFKIGRSLPCLAGFRSIAALYDDVRTYDRALDACDVAALTGGNAGTPATFPRATGDACETNAECASSFCADGVCCNSACGGGAANDCQACSVAAGAAVDGTCSLRSAGTVCRGAAGACDVAESCTGTSASCPDDGLATAGTVCRPAANGCDALESCTGSSVSCPANAFKPNLSLCFGGLLGLPGVCLAGTCVL